MGDYSVLLQSRRVAEKYHVQCPPVTSHGARGSAGENAFTVIGEGIWHSLPFLKLQHFLSLVPIGLAEASVHGSL